LCRQFQNWGALYSGARHPLRFLLPGQTIERSSLPLSKQKLPAGSITDRAGNVRSPVAADRVAAKAQIHPAKAV